MKIFNTLYCFLFISSFASSAAYGLCLGPKEGSEVARISYPGLRENSGIDFSNQHQDIFWTLNDKGSTPEIFALGINGKNFGKFQIHGAKNTDWEDIAVAKCFHAPTKECIYISDTGNNSGAREEFTIYVVEEPQAYQTSGILNLSKTIVFKLSGSHDIEALAVNESKKEFILITKNKKLSSVFTLKDGSSSPQLIATLDFDQLPFKVQKKEKKITAADFDNSSQTLLLGANENAFEVKLADLPQFKFKARRILIPKMEQTEAMAYRWKDGKVSIMATSEGNNQPLYSILCE